MRCPDCGGLAALGVPCNGCIGGIASCCDGIGNTDDGRAAMAALRFVVRRDDAGVLRVVAWTPPVPPAARSELPAPRIAGDIAPYRSMRTGEIITSRSQHREHLRVYDLAEVGNEWVEPRRVAGPLPGEVAEDVRRELARDPGERRALAEQVLRQQGYDGPAIERVLTPPE